MRFFEKNGFYENEKAWFDITYIEIIFIYRQIYNKILFVVILILNGQERGAGIA